MSGETAGSTDVSSGSTASQDPDVDPAEVDDEGGRFDQDRAVRYLQWVGVFVLAVTALVALVGFYTGMSSVIRVWVAEPYRPVFNTAFNLALLLAALGGMGLLLRRLD